ncbi:endo alpha-1,4 polygalactosaminidase [Paracraurococcus lichenis]|uniref:Endo alpha-1,4 polygalactosaminidase n=1 Tax=Paracraurococcus lichenis TaxID=3064888 RepID=A0ABT9E6N1_9PROT|nr:endo alpha-1,4 polygalactosaminidase [Paracraurococcus sp. LOR1-02]MDO9711747.1 endo alpha-1,4 polygalactosaminidase [Paracraurococcus sp. LOR1-02]
MTGDPRFLVYYGGEAQDAIRQYGLAVLDPAIKANLARCRGPDSLLLGYLSLGEVHAGQSYAPALARAGLLFEPNPNWPDARLLDMRSAQWREWVVERLVPTILARGFDGLFFDTLDNAEALEQRDPVRFGGMVAGAAALVRAVRQRFAGVPLMINRGYAVLPQIAGQFDMLLGESVYSTFDAGAKGYRLMPEAGYAWQVERLRAARERDRRLRVFSLDYWDPQDRAGLARIYAVQRANGFVPYVATPDLTRIVPAP